MRRDLVVFVAALGESAKDVGLAPQESKEGHAILPYPSNRPQERVRIVEPHDKNFVLNSISFIFKLVNDRGETIDDIVTGATLLDYHIQEEKEA